MTEYGKTYGDALYDLAAEEGKVEQYLADVELIASVLAQNPEYRKLLSSPAVTKAERETMLDEAWHESAQPYVLNFLKLLCANGKVAQFGDCAKAFRQRYNREHNILPVTAISAAPLSQAQKQRLREKLTAKTGKTIQLTAVVDESLLGGIRLQMGDTELDGSVRHHLDELGRILQSTTL